MKTTLYKLKINLTKEDILELIDDTKFSYDILINKHNNLYNSLIEMYGSIEYAPFEQLDNLNKLANKINKTFKKYSKLLSRIYKSEYKAERKILKWYIKLNI